MKQIIGITKVKDHHKFKCFLRKNYPNPSNNQFDELIFHINNNNFVWYIRCEENEIRSISEYCNLFINSSKYMEQNQFKFKPFDPVLVRNTEEQIWKPNFYAFEGYNSSGYVCTNDMKYAQCIPYNEQTAHLVGTNEPYREPEPKVWKVRCHKNNQMFRFTNDELKRFIENAVINSKDIQWFTTTYDENNS